MVLVSDPIVPASLFVATAVEGGSPTNMRAGSEMRPPPPTTESINAAKKPKRRRISKTLRSKSNGKTGHLFSRCNILIISERGEAVNRLRKIFTNGYLIVHRVEQVFLGISLLIV